MAMFKIVDGEQVEMTPGEIAAFTYQQEIDTVEPAPAPYRLYKSVFISRLTSEEAAVMESVLLGVDAKLRLMFNSVEYFVSDDALFDTLVDAVGAALGAERAGELLAED